MSVTVNALEANTLTATISLPVNATTMVGAHVFFPAGTTLASVNAWAGLFSTNSDWRGYTNSSRTAISSYFFTENIQRNGQTVAEDTWTFVGAFFGPFDGAAHDHVAYTGALTNNDVSEVTNSLTENFTEIKAGGEYRNANNFSTLQEASLAELFVFSGITKANADTIANEANTLVPSAFSITPDHAWSFLNNGTASVGGVNMASGGSPVFASGNHPALSGAPPPPPPPTGPTSRLFVV